MEWLKAFCPMPAARDCLRDQSSEAHSLCLQLFDTANQTTATFPHANPMFLGLVHMKRLQPMIPSQAWTSRNLTSTRLPFAMCTALQAHTLYEHPLEAPYWEPGLILQALE
jgi:hypothetical protein